MLTLKARAQSGRSSKRRDNLNSNPNVETLTFGLKPNEMTEKIAGVRDTTSTQSPCGIRNRLRIELVLLCLKVSANRMSANPNLTTTITTRI